MQTWGQINEYFVFVLVFHGGLFVFVIEIQYYILHLKYDNYSRYSKYKILVYSSVLSSSRKNL